MAFLINCEQNAVYENIMDNRYELVEDFPVWAIEPMVNDTWGDYLQYNGEELAREDFQDIDNYMKSHGFCGIAAPSDEMYDQTHSDFTVHPAFGKSTDTCSVYAIKGEWDSLIEQFDLGSDSEDEDNDKTNITVAGVKQLITLLGMGITNIWYDGNKSRPVFDCVPTSNPSFPGGPICVLVEEPYEARIWLKTANPRNNGLVEDITSLETLQNELADLLNNPPVDQEQEYGKYIDRAMMDHYDSMNGDIGDIDFQCDMRNVCEKAGMHALAEAIDALYKACHPVMEAVDVPMQIFEDYLKQNNITDIDEDQLEQIITNLILGKRITREEGNEIYNKVMDRINQSQNANKPIVTESTDDDDDDDKYDPEFGPVNSDSKNSCTCMICGKPCGIGSFRGGSVVCPDCEDSRWNR